MINVFTLAEMQLAREKRNRHDKIYATLLIRRIHTIMNYLGKENQKENSKKSKANF